MANRAGLSAFLITHIFYIVAFISVIDIFHWWFPVILSIIGVSFVLYIYPNLGYQKKTPVILYIVFILVMVWTAAEVLEQDPQIGAILILFGAVLFAVSDLILALNRFQKSYSSARALNLMAYYTAQILIASSVGILVK